MDAMATKTAVLRLTDDGLQFEATTGSGHTIVLDDSARDYGRQARGAARRGARGVHGDGRDLDPAQEAPAGHRRTRSASAGTQMREQPHAFTRFDVVHVVDGAGIDAEAVRRSVELSATKYCSVGSTLAPGMLEIHHAYLLRDPDGTERSADVVVMGPHEPYERPAEGA